VITAIVQLIASVFAYFVARGLDALLGKWVAYFTIAWDHVASKAALEEYRKTRSDLASAMPDKWKEWDEWRKNLGK
jgi:hypothetical protein